VSSGQKAALARAAGAELVVEYPTADVVAAVRGWAPGGVERVIEVAIGANAEVDAEVLAANRDIISYGAPDKPITVPRALMVKNGGVRFVLVYTMPDPSTEQAVADITAALRAGALTALPAVRFPLDQIDAAHEAVRSHAVGKVLVDIP
jgi:NADPH2:quinone reductase